MTTVKTFKERVAEVEKALGDAHIMCDVCGIDGASVWMLIVEIDGGDWKHDHLRCDWIVQEMGWTHISTTEFGEDTECDWYSATHRYIIEK